jgi:hypothetical protein
MIDENNVRELFSYDLETGILFRKFNTGGPVVASVYYKGLKWEKTHIIWLYVHGRWPKVYIDHIDRDRNNNRLSNLREATHKQNSYNQVRPNSHGYKGIAFDPWRSKPWRAQIRINGAKVNLGRFKTKEEATEAYCNAALEHHGEFACPETVGLQSTTEW